MSSDLLLSVKDATVSYGTKPFFEDLSFNIHDRTRISLVGKNGAGKSTLMKVITGEKELDAGERWVLQGLTIGYLQQDVVPKPGQTVFDFIFEQVQGDPDVEGDQSYKVEQVVEPLELDINDRMDRLSGGQLRRAALARALVEEPDILLLDEPTNHLDLHIIQWLEDYLQSYRGALLCISHDRAFLSAISNHIFWLDRGNLRTCPKGFAHFDDWSTMLLDQEARELKNREKAVAIEVEWASRGIKARRKRNIQRLEKMRAAREKLKADKSAYRQATQKIEIDVPEAEMSSKIVTEFFNVCKKFTDENGKETLILDKFNLRIKRGERIGVLGKNGSGKTTFLKLLVGELEQDSGKIKLAKNLEFSYFDQRRAGLNLDHSLWRTLCPNGGDYIDVMGKSRHVCGYLKDFMFDPAAARDLVGTLSGGQKNRLMLAKVLANPGSFLILDEPTNDLDMDTLDMLEEILINYNGTLIVVSHDRDFLDQTVTKILAFEGDGEIADYVGGYSDYLAATKPQSEKPVKQQDSKPDEKPEEPQKDKRTNKLTYKLQFELDNLPDKIKALEDDIADLKEILSDPKLYMEDPDKFNQSSERLARARSELEQAELRWLELDEMRESVEA